MQKQKGFIPIIVAISIIVLTGLVGYLVVLVVKEKEPQKKADVANETSDSSKSNLGQLEKKTAGQPSDGGNLNNQPSSEKPPALSPPANPKPTASTQDNWSKFSSRYGVSFSYPEGKITPIEDSSQLHFVTAEPDFKQVGIWVFADKNFKDFANELTSQGTESREVWTVDTTFKGRAGIVIFLKENGVTNKFLTLVKINEARTMGIMEAVLTAGQTEKEIYYKIIETLTFD